MSTLTVSVPTELLLQMRKALPNYALTYGQALMIAKMQAGRLRHLLNIRTTRLPLDWVEAIPHLTLQVLSAHEIERLAGQPASGLTKWNQKTGTYLVAINKNMSVTHRRFSLAHELAHVMTCHHGDTIFAQIGHGDAELRHDRVERICNHFAANLLMPDPLVKRMWGFGIQGVPELAAEFGVSEEAMLIRLRNIGLIDEDRDRPTRYFFRRPGLAMARNQLTEEVIRNEYNAEHNHAR